MNKKISLRTLLLICWCFFIILMLFGAEILKIKTARTRPTDFVSTTLFAIASFPHLIKETFSTLKHPNLLEVDNIYPGSSNFSVKQNFVDSNYILLSTYDHKKNRAVVKLMRLSDQKTLHEWAPDFDDLETRLQNQSEFWQAPVKRNIRIYHPLLLPDGSLIFHNIISPLVKINKDSKVVWTLNGKFHHSLELDAEGNIWGESIIKKSKFFPRVLVGLMDNSITEVSPGGKLLFEKSVAEILYENGYRGLLLGSPMEDDLLHVNDVQPALTSTKYWKKGDLLVSVRHRSTVFLYRPSTNKILWLQTGPWLNQHDADFIDSTKIGIFGNDVIRSNDPNLKLLNYTGVILKNTNQEYLYDFKTNKTDTPYAEFFKKAKIATLTEGRSDILSNGDLFVEESNNNRLLRGNKKEIVWQYIDRIDNKTNAVLSWSRFITKEEFSSLNFLHVN